VTGRSVSKKTGNRKGLAETLKVRKRKAARSVEAKQQRREEIIHAALALFVRKGFSAGSMNELARELGIAKGTLYVYFPSKEALWLAIVELIAGEFDAFLRPVVGSSLRPLDKLVRIARLVFDYYERNADVCAILIKIWASTDASLATDMRAWLRQAYRDYREMLASILREGIAAGEIRPETDPQSAASFILALLDGLIVQWLAEPALFNAERCVHAFRSVCLEGLAADRACHRE